MDNRSSSNPMYAHHETMDVAPPRRWRAVIPSWLRSLIWVDAASSYDAFLSYSWKCDREVAPVMQAVMHQFLRPWYKVRARTIFRDLSCLPAGSDLESELFSRLDRSSNLIVLASPEAANSRGMELEAAYWLHRERTKREVLIVVTDRRPSEKAQPETWDEIRNHLIPPTFRNHFATTEPLWISIAVRRQEIVADPRREATRDRLIEDLKQVFLRLYPGATWEELHGDERTQRRRAMALVCLVAALFLLAAVLVWREGIIALRKSEEATFNYNEAVNGATQTSDVVREQMMPGGSDRPKSVTAKSLLDVSRKTYDALRSQYETPATGLLRVKLFESLWTEYFILGDLSSASDVANTEFKLAEKYERLEEGKSSHSDWLRYMCRAQENLADDYRATNKRVAAEAAFRQALTFALKLSDEPIDGHWKSELPHAYERLGDVLRDEYKFSEALVQFRKSLDQFNGFTALQSANDTQGVVGIQRNIATLHGKIGDLLIEKGDLSDALEEFKANLKVSENLLKVVPDNLDAQRGAAVANERIGFVLRRQARLIDASQHYKAELGIVMQLVMKDKSNFQWARDESLAAEGLGDVSLARNRLSEAYEFYQHYLKAIRRALANSRSNTRIRREVAVAYQRLGDTSLRLGESARARKEFSDCATTSRAASTDFEPRNPEPRDVTSYCTARLGGQSRD